MESNGRIPPYMRRPLPDPVLFHPEPFVLSVHPPPGALPPEIMERARASQHMDMQNLAIENQRLAATYSASRHDLAAAQHELQRMQALMMAGKSEHEHQIRAILDKIAKMEADLKASEPVTVELQQARVEAQSLNVARQELISKVQQLTQDLQKIHGDAQQISSLVSELSALRQEYQGCRATYDYERKLRVDHYESLQLMEKNYVSMVGEVENLRRELSKATNTDKTGYKGNDASAQHPLGQSAYEDIYRVYQAIGARPAPATSLPEYETARNTSYEAPRSAVHDASYEALRSGIYATSTLPHYDLSRASSYELLKGFPGYASHNVSGAAQGALAAANPTPTYEVGQPLASYASSQLPSAYGALQVPTAYGTSQTLARPASGYEAPASAGITIQGRR